MATEPTPSALLHQAIAGLEAAISVRRHPWRWLAVASLDASGAPTVRTMVLRAVWATPGRLAIGLSSDLRAPKIAGLRRDRRVAVLALDPERMVQLRLTGVAGLEGPEQHPQLAAAALAHRGGADFLRSVAPGAPVVDPDAIALDRDLWPGTWTLLRVTVTAVDWLDLAADPPRRAHLDPADAAASTWVAP